MEQVIDEMNKVIYVKCTEDEKSKIILEYAAYQMYDYEFFFIIEDETTSQ